ncbi:MAG: nitroreductase [Clostridiales bacterium]|jgi:nitroreductase|nr:nitroreductase [Clostridiales bacterium]
MDFYEVITKRRSVRKYSARPSKEQLDGLREFLRTVKPLDAGIRVEMIVAGPESVRKTHADDAVLFYSESKGDYLLNCGYMLQQVEFYLQTHGIGVCWMGMGKTTFEAPEGTEHVIMLTFGIAEGSLYREAGDFKRKELKQLVHPYFANDALELARYAPSAVNTQPWRFRDGGDCIHIYQAEPGFILKIAGVFRMNCIDMGILLEFLAVIYEHNGKTAVFAKSDAPKISGLTYIISINK